VRRRWQWLAGALAVVVLVLVNAWLRPFRPPPEPDPVQREERINYALSDFDARFFNGDGELTLEVRGPLLEHGAETRVATIQNPRFRIDPNRSNWSGRAERAEIQRDSQTLRLDGAVRLESPHPRGEIIATSERMHYDHPSATLHSPVPAHIEQAGTELSGGTLTVWINDQRMELHHDVHAIYRAGTSRPGDDGARD